jgi:hypothetical protein
MTGGWLTYGITHIFMGFIYQEQMVDFIDLTKKQCVLVGFLKTTPVCSTKKHSGLMGKR